MTSNGDWFITCNEDWVTVNPSFGSAGMTKVEITVTDNVDSYNELNGPRSAVVNFCYGETGVAPLTVKLNCQRCNTCLTITEVNDC